MSLLSALGASTLLVVEGVILRELLKRVASMRGRVMSVKYNRSDVHLQGGTGIPRFSATLLDGSAIVRHSQFVGDESVLLFINPTHSSDSGYKHFNTAAHALWHSVRGNLYIVCSGTKDSCMALVHTHGLQGLKVLVDGTGDIAEKFMVTYTPEGFRFDEDGSLIRRGTPA